MVQLVVVSESGRNFRVTLVNYLRSLFIITDKVCFMKFLSLKQVDHQRSILTNKVRLYCPC